MKIFAIFFTMSILVWGQSCATQKKSDSKVQADKPVISLCTTTEEPPTLESKLQKAIELMSDTKNMPQALTLLDECLSQNKDCVEAYVWRSRIFVNYKEYGKAIADLDQAIKVNNREKSDISTSLLWYFKAKVYHLADDLENTELSYREAIKYASDEDDDKVLRDAIFELADLFFNCGRIDESDKLYRLLQLRNPSDQSSLVGLARNCAIRENYYEAIRLCERSISYGMDFTPQYGVLMFVYDKLGNRDKAVDNALILLEKDYEEYSTYMEGIILNHQSYTIEKIQQKLKSAKDTYMWRDLLRNIYVNNREWENAILQLDAIEKEHGADGYILFNRAQYYSELSLTDKALEQIKKYSEIDEMDSYYYFLLGMIYSSASRVKDAIRAFDKYIEHLHDSSHGYYMKGESYEYIGNYSKAIETYDSGIKVNDQFPFIFLKRGKLLLMSGQTEKARADFERVLELDTKLTAHSSRQQALHFLGRDDEAKEWIDNMLKEYPNDYNSWYDAACLYALMGDFSKAMQYFETSLNLCSGKYSFLYTITKDRDLDALRNRDDFKRLTKKYMEDIEKRAALFKKRNL